MSWYFDEVDDYVTLADDAALTLPNDDWTIAGWLKTTDNTGSYFQYFFSWGVVSQAASINLYTAEDSFSVAGIRKKALIVALGNSGSSFNPVGDKPSTADIATGDWVHVALRFTKSTHTMQWFVNGVADYSWSVPAADYAINYGAALYFGSRSTSPTDRYFGGRLAEWAKWDSALSDTDLASLAGGAIPDTIGTRTWYCPMYDDFSESELGLTVTANGSTVSSADHPISYSSAITVTVNQATESDSGQAFAVSPKRRLVNQVTQTNTAQTLAGLAKTVSVNQATETDTPQTVTVHLSGGEQIIAISQVTESDSVQSVTPLNVGLTSPADRGTLLLSACSVTPNGTTPIITVQSRFDGDENAGGKRFLYGKITGVNGLTPAFRMPKSGVDVVLADSLKFVYSYDNVTWYQLANRSNDATYFYFSHSSAFTGDTVYFASFWPWPVSYTLPWIESLESSGYVSEAPSSLGNNYVFETRSATVNSLSEVISATDLYSFKVSSGAGNAPDGQPKRKTVMFGGMHAAEDAGNHNLKGAVEWLVSGDTQAITLLDWFDFFVYPVVASAGRKGGAQRADFQTGYLLSDVNRKWNTTHLEVIEKHKAAVQTDCGDVVDVMFDWHGAQSGTNYNNLFESADIATWQPAIQTYRPGLPVYSYTDTSTSLAWGHIAKGAEFSITPEQQYASAVTYADLLDYGADHLRALSDIADSNYFSHYIVPVGQVVDTDTPQPIATLGNKIIGVNQVAESEFAQALAHYKTKGVLQAASGDTAQAITHAKRLAIGQATDTSTALPITKSGPKLVALNTVVEGDSAQAITVYGSSPTTLTAADLAAIDALIVARVADHANAVWAHASATQIETLLTEAWGRLGLDPTNPLISGQTEISFGSIVMALSGNQVSSTLTRQ